MQKVVFTLLLFIAIAQATSPYVKSLTTVDKTMNLKFVDEYVSPKKGNCTTDADCSYNGRCKLDGECKCDDAYATYPADNPAQCNYERKSGLIAFLLSFFLGWTGAGFFYVQGASSALGIATIMMFVCVLVLACAAGCAGDKAGCAFVSYVLALCASLAWMGLYMYSWIGVLAYSYQDANGFNVEGL